MQRRLALLAFERFDRAELKFCRALNRSTRSSAVRNPFKTASWLGGGDGRFWYGSLGALPPIYGAAGGFAALYTRLTALAAPLVPLTVLIALSRMILGLHYPTDVAAGVLLRGSLGMASLLLGQMAAV
jgi:membrane-associated phospholipid phosphatase